MPREASWISALLGLSVFTVAVGVGGFLLWSWLSTVRMQRQRANAERYRTYYAGRHNWLDRVQPLSVLSPVTETELDRYRCLYLAWRVLEEYGWLDRFGSIAALGMVEISRLNQPERRLDKHLYRSLARRRPRPGWEREWDYPARVDSPFAWKLKALLGRRPSLNSPFMDMCTLVIMHAFHNRAEAHGSRAPDTKPARHYAAGRMARMSSARAHEPRCVSNPAASARRSAQPVLRRLAGCTV